ncbi:hypothetical protein GS448_15850 [Rhodococcus hoagii]|nr:hypothetical protein [Prescottella equi]MBM4668522.1 hypothetical protein [Prescottella equi]NKV88747.1 hypothetical protein [Prescottella equi]
MTHDRTGERVDDDALTQSHPITHDPRCHKGWLGEDPDGRLIPCLRCRPHLLKTADVNDHALIR